MAESTIWWVLAGGAVAAELLSGTFYLLMVSIGLAAAAIAAHLGLPFSAQLVTAAIVGGGTVAAWHFARERHPKALPASANADVNQDIGATVQVDAWNVDGTASVKYRGANWTVVTTDGAPSTGAHRVKEVVGSRFVVEKI